MNRPLSRRIMCRVGASGLLMATAWLMASAPAAGRPADGSTEETELPTVTLCDLGQNPYAYQGKVVRVMVDIRGRTELSVEMVGRHEPCASYMLVLLAFPADVRPMPDFRVEEDESFRKLQQALRTTAQIEAMVEARFDAVLTPNGERLEWTGRGYGPERLGYGKKRLAEGRLVLRRVSDVVVRPLPRK